MKNLCILALLLSVIFHSAVAFGNEKPLSKAIEEFASGKKGTRIAVLDFSSSGSRNYDMYVADIIITELSKYPVTLLERKRLQLLLNEQALGQTGVVDADQAKKLGTLLPVDVVVSGSYTELNGKLVINARFIHVVTGEILYAFASSLPISAAADAPTDEERENSQCLKKQAAVRKSLEDLTTSDAVSNAVNCASAVPFEGDCGRIHYEVMGIFVRYKIYPEKYSSFLAAVLKSIDTPTNDPRANDIIRYFVSDGKIDAQEWAASFDALSRMGPFALHIPLNYMLNNSNEDNDLVLDRVDQIMKLAASKKLGRPVAVPEETVLFAVLHAVKPRDRDKKKGITGDIFARYRHLVPDTDRHSKEAVEILQNAYFEEKSRPTRRQILMVLVDFYGSRPDSEELAEKAADLIRTMNSKIERDYSGEPAEKAAFAEDLKTINRSLQNQYCLSLELARKKGYHYIVDDRVEYILGNGMKCAQAPSIADLEAAMKAGDWGKRLKAVETLSKIGAAAAPAEKTLVACLAWKGLGSEGGRMRALCAKTLGNIGGVGPEAITMLISSFPDYDNGVSYEAEEAIAKIGPAAIQHLVRGLEHEHHAVRLRCATALGRLGKKARQALAVLKKTAEKDADPYVRKEAAGAVQMIENEP